MWYEEDYGNFFIDQKRLVRHKTFDLKATISGDKAVKKDNSGLKSAKYRYEKALSQRLRAYQLSGGTDGTRTRDPLRDRQVF